MGLQAWGTCIVTLLVRKSASLYCNKLAAICGNLLVASLQQAYSHCKKLPIVCCEKDEGVIEDALLLQLLDDLTDLPVHCSEGVPIIPAKSAPRVPPIRVRRVVRVSERIIQEETSICLRALTNGVTGLRGVLFVEGQEVDGLLDDGGAVVERAGAVVVLAAVGTGPVWVEAYAARTVAVGCWKTCMG